MELHELSLTQAVDLLARGEVSSLELTKAIIKRIEDTEPQVKAYLTLTGEAALEQAKAADQAREKGQAGPLCGVPAGLKDVLCTAGMRTTCGSKILNNFVPPL